MLAELDILALEPFYGGGRRAMLDTLMKCSRHRWTMMKLPPRRIERRLATAAHWFAEQLNLHWVANVDLIFTSEAINLADLYRLVPNFVGKPSVVYFHDNQLPHAGAMDDINAPAAPSILANLATAASAAELWFNTECHHRVFFQRAQALLERHVQNFTRNPLNEISRKCKLMPPPTDLTLPEQIKATDHTDRDKRTLFIDTVDGDLAMITRGLEMLRDRGEAFQLNICGPVTPQLAQLPHTRIPDHDENVIVQALLDSAVYINGRLNAVWDHRLIMAIAANCWPVVPGTGFYADLIGQPMDERCLYDCTPQGLYYNVQDFWELILPTGYEQAVETMLAPYHAMPAAMAMDERLAEIAITTTGTTAS